MRSPARLLQTTSSDNLTAAAPAPLAVVSSDVVVVLAALLCALFCAVGLALVARCAWLRRRDGGAPNKGLTKKVIRSLPKQSYGGGGGECPICLSEFVEGDEIRILPQCGHGFHVGCIDPWFVSHSSCPFCRRVLVAAVVATASRCQRCGAPAAPRSSSDAAGSAAAEYNTMAGDGGAGR